jgi:hypothetical protein
VVTVVQEAVEQLVQMVVLEQLVKVTQVETLTAYNKQVQVAVALVLLVVILDQTLITQLLAVLVHQTLTQVQQLHTQAEAEVVVGMN